MAARHQGFLLRAVSAIAGCALAAGCTPIAAGAGAAGAPTTTVHSALSAATSPFLDRTLGTTRPGTTRGPAATRPATPRPPAATPPRPPGTRPHPSTIPSAARLVQLPRGGRQIFPTYRVIAYYGGPDGPALGVLGSADPDTIATEIEARAGQYVSFGRAVQPAIELIATVARPCTASHPTCSAPVPDQAIQRYLDVAHRHKMLLILDFQPGRGEFLPQVEAVQTYLTDPSVSVALDPEWKLGPDQVPMRAIGAASAASINAVSSYLSALVTAHKLPDKLLVIHQFTLRMLPDRRNLVRAPGLETVLHADGFGAPTAKTQVYASLGFPGPPFRAGFKLFFRQDPVLMSPGSVMALRPQPDIITYQ